MSFGQPPVDKKDRPIRMAVPLRPLNQIEWALRTMMQEEIETQGDAPLPFIEDNELGNGDDYIPIFGRSLTFNEAMFARDILAAPIMEKYRRQINLARDLGGKAISAEYFLGCEMQRLDPVLQEQTR